ncbi:MAG: hypothetical protein ACRYG5_03110 [Janthinobacterium lividum]
MRNRRDLAVLMLLSQDDEPMPAEAQARDARLERQIAALEALGTGARWTVPRFRLALSDRPRRKHS